MSYKTKESIPLELLGQIKAEDVVKHALLAGWKRIPDPKEELAILRRPENENEEFLLPLKEFRDYDDLLRAAVSYLAGYENKTPLQIAEELVLPASDLFSFRVMDATTESGTVMLIDGLNLLNGAKKALSAAACSVLKPQKFHPRLSRGQAEDFINGCRLGQTQVGSFIAQIICPIDPLPFEESEPQANLFGRTETFGRKATRTLITALHTLEQSIQKENIDGIEQLGVSSNLCDALLEMQPEGKGSTLTVGADWSVSLPTKDFPTHPVRLRKETFPIIEQVALALRPKRPPETDFFVGRVDELNGGPGPEGMAGEVVLILFLEDEVLRARVDMSHEDYVTACDAHRDSEVIFIKGELHRHGRLHEIKKYEDFDLVGNLKGLED